jgi:hypothetical protein
MYSALIHMKNRPLQLPSPPPPTCQAALDIVSAVSGGGALITPLTLTPSKLELEALEYDHVHGGKLPSFLLVATMSYASPAA